MTYRVAAIPMTLNDLLFRSKLGFSRILETL